MSSGNPARSHASPSAWLVILSEADGLRWVLAERRMAFSRGQTPRALGIRKGDRLFLYVARGAYHNPTRDESQVIAVATASSAVAMLPGPVVIRDREFVSGCRLRIDLVFPERQGVPFRPLVGRLRFIRVRSTWSAYMRSSLIALPLSDAAVLEAACDAHRPQAASRTGKLPRVTRS